MAPVKKSKSLKSNESLNAKLALAVKSGKYFLGYKSALKQMRSGKGEPSLLSTSRDWSVRLRRSLLLTLVLVYSQAHLDCW
jgi:ribosomal protein L30E